MNEWPHCCGVILFLTFSLVCLIHDTFRYFSLNKKINDRWYWSGHVFRDVQLKLVKGLVHSKKWKLSSVVHRHVVPILHDFFFLWNMKEDILRNVCVVFVRTVEVSDHPVWLSTLFKISSLVFFRYKEMYAGLEWHEGEQENLNLWVIYHSLSWSSYTIKSRITSVNFCIYIIYFFVCFAVCEVLHTNLDWIAWNVYMMYMQVHVHTDVYIRSAERVCIYACVFMYVYILYVYIL